MPEQPMQAQSTMGAALEPAIVTRPRLVSALGTWVPTALLVVLAVASSLWLSKVGEREEQATPFTDRAPDLTMEEFEVTTMGEDGNPIRRLSAAYLAHFTASDTKELTHPHLIVYRENGEPWNIASERGWISADNDVLMLLGKVDIWRNYADGKREIHIETEDLRVFPDVQFAQTKLPVSISTPETYTRATGMRAYLDQGRVQLLSKVKTTIESAVP